MTILRDRVLTHLAAVEVRLKTLTEAAELAGFYSRLSLIKEELKALMQRLPSPSQPPAMSEDLTNLLAAIKANLEKLNESVNGVARADLLLNAWKAPLAQDQLSQVASQATSSTVAFVRKMEERVLALGAKGRDRAHSVVLRAAEAAKQTEDQFYRTALELAQGGRNLISYDQLPDLWRNNEYILTGYRFIPLRNWSALIRSTFELHNESGNVWSHLLGIFIVLPLFWPKANAKLDPDTTPMDRMVQTIYLIAAVKCLFLSVSWHVMAGCADHKVFEMFACVDYTGIAWLVAASIWTIIYNSFYCQPNLALAYSISTFVVGLVGAVVPFMEFFNRRENKIWRIAMFLSMCFTGLLPFSHAAYEHGLLKTAAFLSPVIPSLLSYIGGLVFYATHFPESRAPGRFDYFGSAHNIWHVSIVLAICLHYRAALIWHDQRFEFSCSGVPPTAMIGSLLEAAGGLGGSTSLDRADAKVYHFRKFLGTFANGQVGNIYNRFVDFLQQTF